MPVSSAATQDLLADAQRRLSKFLQAESSNRLEHRSLLATNLSRLSSVTSQTRVAIFSPWLFHGEGDLDAPVALQLLQLLCEGKPKSTAGFVSRRPWIVRAIFKKSDLNILAWFAHFSMDGMSSFKYGAYALARYALAHRDHAWSFLVWEGKHPQAPVAVATRPHYFCELNVIRTVRNLLELCPEFWESEELAQSLESGEFLSIDYACVASELQKIACNLTKNRDVLELRELVESYLGEEDFDVLGQSLLHLANDHQLLQVVNVLSREQGSLTCSQGDPGASLLPMVLGEVHWRRLDDALLCHALACERAQLMRLMQDEEDGQVLLAWLRAAARRQLTEPGMASGLEAQLRQLARQLSEPGSRILLVLVSWLVQLFLEDEVARSPLTVQAALAPLGFSLEPAGGTDLISRLPGGSAPAAPTGGPRHSSKHHLLDEAGEKPNSSKGRTKKRRHRKEHRKKEKRRKRRNCREAVSSSDGDHRQKRRRVGAGGSESDDTEGEKKSKLEGGLGTSDSEDTAQGKKRRLGGGVGAPDDDGTDRGKKRESDGGFGASDSGDSGIRRTRQGAGAGASDSDDSGTVHSSDQDAIPPRSARNSHRKKKRRKRRGHGSSTTSDSRDLSLPSDDLLPLDGFSRPRSPGEEGELVADAGVGRQWRVGHAGHAVTSSLADVAEYISACLCKRWAMGASHVPKFC